MSVLIGELWQNDLSNFVNAQLFDDGCFANSKCKQFAYYINSSTSH